MNQLIFIGYSNRKFLYFVACVYEKKKKGDRHLFQEVAVSNINIYLEKVPDPFFKGGSQSYRTCAIFAASWSLKRGNVTV